MKRFRILSMVMFTMMLSSVLSFADSFTQGAAFADKPVLSKGESWTMKSGATETFLRTEGNSLIFYREDKQFSGERYRTDELNLVHDIKEGAPVNTRRPHLGLLSFPLFVGKSWGMSYQNKGTWRSNRYEVTAFEKVETKAGVFDAFRIEGIDKNDGRSLGIKVTMWYAPTAKVIVKMTGENEADHLGVAGWNYELANYYAP